MKFFVMIAFLILLFFPVCNRERYPPVSTRIEVIIEEESGNEGLNLIQQENNYITSEEMNLYNVIETSEVSVMKIHENSWLAIESLALITPDGSSWSFGRIVDESFFERENTTAFTDVFTRSGGPIFGPIPAMQDEYLKIGWDRRGVVFYIEALSSDVKTFDGIRLRDTKEKVIDILGLPLIEYEDLFKYVNDENEPQWLLFTFENDSVTSIILLLFF